MTKLSNKRIESFYVLKAISSLFVVAVHSSIIGRISLFPILSLGTLCFLSITGYLLYSESEEKVLKKCLRWAYKMFYLSIVSAIVYLIMWSVFYMVCPSRLGTIYQPSFIRDTLSLISSGSGMREFAEVCVRRFCDWLATGRAVNPYLWYLTAVWQSLLIFYVFRKYAPKFIYGFLLLYIVMHIATANPDFFFGDAAKVVVVRLRLSVITAIIFLSTGYLIHKHEVLLMRWIRVHIWLPVLLVAILLEPQIRMWIIGVDDAELKLKWALSTFPLVVVFMLTCIRCSNLRIPFLSNIGENHSANIYYFHAIVLYVFQLSGIEMPYIHALVVWIMCVPLSALFNTIKSQIQNYCRRSVAS